jgi:hypothetical protein
MTIEQTKICPDCAEQIKLDAVKCRFCGYRYEQPAGVSSGTPALGASAAPFAWEEQPALAPSVDPRPRRRSIGAPVAIVFVVAIGAAIAVLALSGSSGGAAEAATCRSQTHATFSALSTLSSRLQVGMNLDSYTTAVGDANVAVNRLASLRLGPGCHLVTAQLERAVGQHEAASSDWNGSLQNGTVVDEQGHWASAQQYLVVARADLAGIGSTAGARSIVNAEAFAAATSSDAAAKELAHTAQVAIETYATDENGSYAGATSATLHEYEGTIQVGPGGGNAYLPASNGVQIASDGSAYTVTTISVTGDRFAITRGENGAITRSCISAMGVHGGCASGTW